MGPIVNGLKKEFPQVSVESVEISSPRGRDLAKMWGVTLVPTFMVFSADGNQLDRAEGFQPPARLRRMFLLSSSSDGGLRHEG